MADDLVEQAAPKARRKRRIAKTDTQKRGRADGRVAATLLLPESVDFRLSAIAKSLAMSKAPKPEGESKWDRSTLAAYLLDAGLRRYGLDAALRQHLGLDDPAAGDGAGE